MLKKKHGWKWDNWLVATSFEIPIPIPGQYQAMDIKNDPSTLDSSVMTLL